MSGPKQADQLLALAGDLGLFHAPDGTGYARLPVAATPDGTIAAHVETLAIRKTPFRSWLRYGFYRESGGKAPGAQPLQDAIDQIDARARYEGPEQPVFLRLAEDQRSGNIYLDLGDPEWTAVEIAAADPHSHRGWRRVNNPPVNFRRTPTMTALPCPERGGSADELKSFVNVREDDFMLILGWLIDALRPRGPHVVLGFQGEQGAAKSFTSRVLLGLIDPSLAPLRTMPKEPRDLAIMASGAWGLGFDNISKLFPAQSDALCRLALGAGFSTRRLYTDDDEIVFSGARPIIINGIDNIAERDDLRDRAFMLDCPPVLDKDRQPEADLWAGFDSARPRILGGLLDCVATALRFEPVIRLGAVPRMADACKWVEAAAPELGWSENEFVVAYANNRRAAVEVYVASDAFIAKVEQLAVAGFDGTATELLTAVNSGVDDDTRRNKDWPSTPRAAREQVKRAAGALRAMRVQVVFGQRKITIARTRPEEDEQTPQAAA